MAKQRKQYDDDDGRVVADMNVDGMPWYIREHKPWTQRFASSSQNQDQLTAAEERALIWGAMKAGLLIAGVFILAALAFILFCLFVWFR